MKRSDSNQRQNLLNAKMMKKNKEIIGTLPPFMFIVTEGTATETNYIEGFAAKINKRYGKYSKHKRIEIKGLGKSCLRLLEEADNTVKRICPQAEVIWLVYDKDDFAADSFDNTQYSAENRKSKRKYKVAWSNECIELWFLLHFSDVIPKGGRKDYIQKLESYCHYSKTDKNIFSLLYPMTQTAITRAKRLYDSYPKNYSPSKMYPATRVHEMVEELMKYCGTTNC